MRPLSERLASGDEEAFQALYDQCARSLYRYLVSKTRSAEMAADVLQEAFMRAVRFRDRLRDVDSLEAWLFTVARREADRLLARSNRTGHQQLSETKCVLFADESAQSMLDDRDEIEVALSALTTATREILELHFYGGLTFREIATVTQTPQGTVATRYPSAIATLQRQLNANAVPDSQSEDEANK